MSTSTRGRLARRTHLDAEPYIWYQRPRKAARLGGSTVSIPSAAPATVAPEAAAAAATKKAAAEVFIWLKYQERERSAVAVRAVPALRRGKAMIATATTGSAITRAARAQGLATRGGNGRAESCTDAYCRSPVAVVHL